MNRDSVYYEKIFESLFPTLKKYDLKEEINKIVDLLKETFIDIDVEYTIQYGGELVFHVEKVAGHTFDWNMRFDLSCYHIQHKDELKEIIFPEIKYFLLKFWDSKILKE